MVGLHISQTRFLDNIKKQNKVKSFVVGAFSLFRRRPGKGNNIFMSPGLAVIL